MATWSLTTLQNIRATRRIDSEFFRPEYVSAEARARTRTFNELGDLGNFVPGPFGSAFSVDNYDEKSTYRYIRGRDVKPFFLLDDDNRYIPESDFTRLSQYQVRSDDLMISVVGTLGNVAVCTEKDTPAVYSCKSTLFRASRADPYFVLSYLNCATGQLCMLRRQRGAIQTGLNMEDLRTIPVPRFDPALEREIAESVRKAHLSLLTSRDAYQSAHNIFDSALGLDILQFKSPVSYTARLSEAMTIGRIDADYFRPPFRQIDEHLDGYATVQLRAIAEIAKGIEVGSTAYERDGHPFLRVSNIKETGIELGASDKFISPTLYSALQEYRPQVGELLLTKDGSPGIAMVVDQETHGIISGGVVRLQPKNCNLPNEYVALAINSRACRMQVERECSGALILHWKPASIQKLRIPLLAEPIMEEIAGWVIRAKLARRKSVELLERAQARVDQLIEEAVAS